MTETGMTLEELLGHKTRDKSEAKTTFLSGWRKRENAHRNTKTNELENTVTIWLHTRALFQARWTHKWPRIVDLVKTQSRAVWSQDLVCLESEAVLRRQYRRTRDGMRDTPPVICPTCLLLEQIRDSVKAGKLDWLTPIFKYEAGPDTVVLHAAGVYGGFSNPKMTPEEKAAMTAIGIYQTEGWKENSTAKCSYICRVVDNDHPEKGVQVSIELDSIGDAMKRRLADEIEGRGDVGNPMRNPYAIQWRFYPDEGDFRKKFSVVPMPKIQLTDEIKSLIVDTDPPPIEHLLKPCNMKNLRNSMEEHCLVDLDWDTVFGPVEALCDENGCYRPEGSKDDPEVSESDSDEIPF